MLAGKNWPKPKSPIHGEGAFEAKETTYEEAPSKRIIRVRCLLS
jgi:hypothetical protein